MAAIAGGAVGGVLLLILVLVLVWYFFKRKRKRNQVEVGPTSATGSHRSNEPAAARRSSTGRVSSSRRLNVVHPSTDKSSSSFDELKVDDVDEKPKFTPAEVLAVASEPLDHNVARDPVRWVLDLRGSERGWKCTT